MASNVTINVSPSPGFCIKSKVLHLNATSTQTHRPVPISEGLKVFVNITWSKDVPPPLDGIEKTSEYAAHSWRMDLKSERSSPIPVFASDGRLDTDKELSLREIEAHNSISLSRILGTPNISSKGVLGQRAISIPSILCPSSHHHRPFSDKSPDKKLVEEVTDSPAAASNVNNTSSLDRGRPRDSVTPHSNGTPETPSWTWRQEGGEIRISIRVPKLTHATISSATLDLEPRRFMLLIPDLYALDIDLDLPDRAPGKARSSVDPQGAEYITTLQQARHLEIERARAEWRVKERSLVIIA